MQYSLYNLPLLFMYVIFFHQISGGPVIRSSRMVREIYPEVEQEIPDSSQTQVCIVGDVVYGAEDNVPSEQLCLKCACTPPDVRCETEICVPQPGCKAIHKTNKCCPDYQCECQHEGKSYGNGERLPYAPGGECLVCYCRGGEKKCAEVGCYTRSDCEPRYISGQCCPIYDHCPPRESLPGKVQHTESLHPIYNSGLSPFPSSSVVKNNTSKNIPEFVAEDINEEGSGAYEESGLLDKPAWPTVNSVSNSKESNLNPSTPVIFSIKEIELNNNNVNIHEKVKVINKVDKATQTDTEGRQQITIQEVLPKKTEHKITSAPQKNILPNAVTVSPNNLVTIESVDFVSSSSTPKMLADTSNELSDVESYASEKTEIYDHPSPVLRIGDQLLFIKQGQLVPEKDASTPTSVITLIGAEGLQIGLESGELLEHEIIHVNLQDSREESQVSISSNSNTKKADENYSHKTSTGISVDDPVNNYETELSSESSSDTKVIKFEIASSENSSVVNDTNEDISGTVFNDTSNEYLSVNNSEEYVSEKATELLVNNDNRSEEIMTTTKPETNIVLTTPPLLVTDHTLSFLSNGDVKLSTSTVNKEQEEFVTENINLFTLSSSTIFEEENNVISSTVQTSVGEGELVPIDSLVRGVNNLHAKSDKNSSTDFQNQDNLEPLFQKNKPEKETVEVNNLGVENNAPLHAQKRILPEVLEIRSNKTIIQNKTISSHEWLKSETPTKIIISLSEERDMKIPLINEKAALPETLLELQAPTDLNVEDFFESHTSPTVTLHFTSEIPPSSSYFDEFISNSSYKLSHTEHPSNSTVTFYDSEPTSDKHILIRKMLVNNETDTDVVDKALEVVNVTTEDMSIETVEVNDDSNESQESTTHRGDHASLMSNEDASIEDIPNDSSPVETSDFVEIVPGYNRNTEVILKTGAEDSVELLNNITNSHSPKNDVEMIQINSNEEFEEGLVSHSEVRDFHEEIQKRDVVKKVLVDTFENPTENIRTEILNITRDPSNLFSNENYYEDQNIVKPNEALKQVN